jgi:hypothetical protein
MDDVDYRKLFWQAFDGLCALEYGANSGLGLLDAAVLRNLRGATTTWRKRLEDQIPPPDDDGWATTGPCACATASAPKEPR